MGSRIDDLEKSIGDLMENSNLSEPAYGSSGGAVSGGTIGSAGKVGGNVGNMKSSGIQNKAGESSIGSSGRISGKNNTGLEM